MKIEDLSNKKTSLEEQNKANLAKAECSYNDVVETKSKELVASEKAKCFDNLVNYLKQQI